MGRPFFRTEGRNVDTEFDVWGHSQVDALARLNVNFDPSLGAPSSTTVPEPATMILFGSGLATIGAALRKRRKRQYSLAGNCTAAKRTLKRCQKQETTFQQGLNGYTGVADTRINFYDPNLNFGSDTKVLILGGTENVKALARFDLSSIPADAAVSSATLSLYNYSHEADINGGTVSVQQVSKPWVENQATWNVSSAGVNWATPGMQPGIDYITCLDTTIPIDTAVNVWRNFDVTAMVRQWVSGAMVNNGFVIRSGRSGVKPRFYSSDYLTDPTLRPKLIVKFETR